MKRLELAGWNEMEDIRRLAECVPKLVWLDLGRRNGCAPGGGAGAAGPGANGGKQAANITTNFVSATWRVGRSLLTCVRAQVDWANILAQMPELTTFHGLRFFYEVACTDSTSLTLSLSDRSRVRKNDEVASVLAWKCPKLRRLDHWDEGSGRIIVLIRDEERVRYEVRRIVKV